MRGDDASDFSLVDGVNEGVLAEVGVQRHHWHTLLHAAVGANEPFGARLREERNVVFRS